ncbi:MAG: hypothetical protein HYV77_00925 [Candidatus Wildermuthbacteria bacterium]|nr:hypothetical protein [Candidatus Wildermuthbacteria bacterium]
MDINEIKQLIQKDGGKFIVIENDIPLLVIMSFDEYKKKINMVAQQSNPQYPATSPPGNVTERPRRTEELTIDDLPL